MARRKKPKVEEPADCDEMQNLIQGGKSVFGTGFGKTPGTPLGTRRCTVTGRYNPQVKIDNPQPEAPVSFGKDGKRIFIAKRAMTPVVQKRDHEPGYVGNYPERKT